MGCARFSDGSTESIRGFLDFDIPIFLGRGRAGYCVGLCVPLWWLLFNEKRTVEEEKRDAPVSVGGTARQEVPQRDQRDFAKRQAQRKYTK